ncbi:MAG: serine/threonine protein kinase [Acidobacteria bacterium]|nr:serine/threonine protein kinase [Acidobacteriota bacterium]MDW7983959.1 serine/threonine-protein kinase [Acidobacteriota bacterium]
MHPASEMPSRIGRYQVLAIIGKGAMGIVYKAFDPIIERTVAIKVLRLPVLTDRQEYGDYLRRFYVEARAAGRLSHPNIVAIHDVGDWDGVPYIVMEFLEGTTLQTYLRRNMVFPWPEATEVIRQVAEALDYAHRHGILHRDIKPANVMILADGRVKVMDFGVALMAGPGTEALGTSEVIVGTPYYIAPEVLEGKSYQPASDIFSLGVVFYQLLTLERPFKGDTFQSVAYAILHTTPLPPSHYEADLPPILDTIVMRMLARSLGDRYISAGALAQDLKRVLASAVDVDLRRLERPAAPTPADETDRRRFRSRWQTWSPVWRWGLIGGLVVGILGAATWVFQRQAAENIRSMPPPAPAGPVSRPTDPEVPAQPSPSLSQELKKEELKKQETLRREIDRRFQLGKNYCMNRLYVRCRDEMEWVLSQAPDHGEARRYLEQALRHLEAPKSRRGQTNP